MLCATDITDKYLQISSYITDLSYTYIDLNNMFIHYIQQEDNMYLHSPQLKEIDAAMAFIGLKKIRHGYVKKDNDYIEEPFFQYLYRHTLKRPRDIMDICNHLYQFGIKNMDLLLIRKIVNKESRIILNSYLKEIEPFILKYNREYYDLLWNYINTNVFTLTYMKYICRRINRELSKKMFCNGNCQECDGYHLFSSIMNIGLLGSIKNNNVHHSDSMQIFKDPGDTIIELNYNNIPASELYFLHPMLTNKIESIRNDNNKSFLICQDCIVGDELAIEKKCIKKITDDEPKKLKELEDEKLFVSSTCHDLHDTRNLIRKLFTECGFIVVTSDSVDFSIHASNIHSHDHCIDELLRCKAIVYLFGNRYGGEYSGTKYENYRKEISNIEPLLSKPSISLMEYFAARKHNLPTYVFITEKLYEERHIFKQNIKAGNNYKPVNVDDTRIFYVLDFVTKQSAGNWHTMYKDMEDLEEIIKIQFRQTICNHNIGNRE